MTLRPSLSAKPTTGHPAPGREDGGKCNDYKYDNDDVDQAAGPTMWGWESGRTGKKRDCCCRLDPPLLLPPTSTFPGGTMCPPPMQSMMTTGSLPILRGQLRSTGGAGDRTQRCRWDNRDCHRRRGRTRQRRLGGTCCRSCCNIEGTIMIAIIIVVVPDNVVREVQATGAVVSLSGVLHHYAARSRWN